MFWCVSGQLACVEWLVEQGHADKDKARADGVTPLLAAIYQGFTVIALWLIRAGADLDKTGGQVRFQTAGLLF